MHTEIQYDAADNVDDITALRDMMNWLGQERYNDIRDSVRMMSNTKENQQYLRMALAIAGITGYPVNLFIKTYLGTGL